MRSRACARDPRWIALYVLCGGMLMIVLDVTIVNVALPSIQHDLRFSTASLAWVVNAYLIAFGGLLLLAGRVGDLIGDLLPGRDGPPGLLVARPAWRAQQAQCRRTGCHRHRRVGVQHGVGARSGLSGTDHQVEEPSVSDGHHTCGLDHEDRSSPSRACAMNHTLGHAARLVLAERNCV
jgi:hypothetical protein